MINLSIQGALVQVDLDMMLLKLFPNRIPLFINRHLSLCTHNNRAKCQTMAWQVMFWFAIYISACGCWLYKHICWESSGYQSLCEQICTPPRRSTTILLIFYWQSRVRRYLNRRGVGIEEQLWRKVRVSGDEPLMCVLCGDNSLACEGRWAGVKEQGQDAGQQTNSGEAEQRKWADLHKSMCFIILLLTMLLYITVSNRATVYKNILWLWPDGADLVCSSTHCGGVAVGVRCVINPWSDKKAHFAHSN